MDVLVYSALNEQAALKKEIAEKRQALFDLKANCVDVAASGGGSGVSAEAYNCAKAWFATGTGEGIRGHWQCPGDTNKWKVYEGEGWSGGVKVCDPTGYYRCGYSCTWYVPSGATKARFQLWGSGGGANKGPCCCGHTPFGSTGAYASVIIPVQTGWCYLLCAGCAYCCYAYTTSGAQRMSGCPSYVQGCHFCEFCADGGQGSLGTWMAMRGGFCYCRIATITNDSTGAYICNYGGDWCFNGPNFGQIEYVAGSDVNAQIYGISCPTWENVVYGIRGIWPRMCWDSNHYGWEQHAPIYGDNMQSTCCPTYSSGNCCGYVCSAWTSSYLRYPSAGGFMSHAMGGGTGNCGDSGKFGMVCVSWQ